MKQNTTPKEKAKHLVKRSMPLAHDWEIDNKIVAVKIALLCVDVILNEVGAKDWDIDTATKTNYWQDVETELSIKLNLLTTPLILPKADLCNHQGIHIKELDNFSNRMICKCGKRF